MNSYTERKKTKKVISNLFLTPKFENLVVTNSNTKRKRGDLKVIEYAHKVTGERFIGKMFNKF